jgi:hypothetical protein
MEYLANAVTQPKGVPAAESMLVHNFQTNNDATILSSLGPEKRP